MITVPGIAYNPVKGVHLRKFGFDKLFDRWRITDHQGRPRLAPGLLMLHVTCTSVCGSDHQFLNNSITAQKKLIKDLPLGHEMAGEVVEVGPGLDETQWKGRIVAVESHVPKSFADWGREAWHKKHTLLSHYSIIGYDAMNCDAAAGAWTPYVVIPFQNAFPLSEKVIYATGKAPSLLEPYGNGVYLTQLLEKKMIETALHPDQVKLLVLGPGQQGQMMMYLANQLGINNIVSADVAATTVEKVNKLGYGPCLRIDPTDKPKHQAEQLFSALHGPADFIIDACGALANFPIGAEVIKPEGTFFFFGLGNSDQVIPGTSTTLHDFIFSQAHQIFRSGDKAFNGLGVIGRTKGSWKKFIATLEADPDSTFAQLIRSSINRIGTLDQFAATLTSIKSAKDLPVGKLVLSPFENY